jgi:hypothetical protein
MVISPSPSVAKQMGLATPPEKITPFADKIKMLRLSDDELTGVPVLLYAKGAVAGAFAGTAMLQNFMLTFDYRKNVVIMERI